MDPRVTATTWWRLSVPETERKTLCFCGSIRFKVVFESEYLLESLKGNICLLPVFEDVPESQCKQLNQLHLDKIKLADEVYVINPSGYMGDGLRAEIAYAKNLGKPIRYLF